MIHRRFGGWMDGRNIW